MPAFPTISNINPLADVLTQRGISAEEAVKMEMLSHTAEQISDLTGFKIPAWLKGTFLPYHDLDGTILLTGDGRPFCRWRMDMVNGAKLPEGQSRYIQPSKSGVAVYLPMNTGINWVDVAHDPSIDLWVTEGEFKAVRAVQEGMVCIGLGGVDNWRSKDGILAKPLDRFVWDKRKVFFCYDADPESTNEVPLKPNVEAALQRATARLGELGAFTFMVSIARTGVFERVRAKDVNAKMGLDDYFKAGGLFKELADTVEKLDHNQEQARLLREYAMYYGKKSHIVRIADGTPFSAYEFSNLIEAPAITIRTDPLNPKKKIKVKEHEAWRENKSHLRIDRYVFDPSGRPGYDSVDKEYNIWSGFELEGRVGDGVNGSESYRETVKMWKRFIGGLFGEQADYFEQWLAHLFQHPGEKTSIGVILASVLTGVGKSLLGEVIRGMVGREGSLAIELDRLKSNFNAVMARRVFVQMDEAEGAFLGLESKLDDMITADTVIIEPKGFDAYSVDNFARLYLTSNSTRPIRIKPGNRRWLVVVPELTVKDSKGEWGRWVREDVAPRLKSREGMEELRWYLGRVDLTGWLPTGRVPVTQAMLDMIESGQTKSGGVLDGLWNALGEDDGGGEPGVAGIWALTGDLTRQDSKVWGDLKAAVKANGGQTMAHAVSVKNKTVRFVVVDRDGKLPRKKVGDQWVLDNAGGDGTRFVLTGEQIQAAAIRAQRAYTTYSEGVGLNSGGGGLRSDKY